MRSSPNPRIYRGVLLGLGGIARSGHLPAFRTDPKVASRLRIVGIVDDAPSAPASFDGIPLLSRPDQLAEFGPVDFVDICTPTSSHLELSLWGLSQGYHVLCEKPVAVNRAEAATLAAAALDAGRVVMPCHQYRFNPVWRRVKQWLDDGVIGRWYLAEFRVYRMAADPGAGAGVALPGPVPWRGSRAGGRGGVLLDHGTHLVYELLDVAGPPQSVRAWTGRLRHGGYDVEDTAQLVFEYPDRMATMFLTWAARRRETEIRFIGERGSITWSGGMLTLERGGKTESFDHTVDLDKASYAKWFAELFHDFAITLDAGDRARPMADIAQVAAVLEASYAAVA